jgi:hypothetical protein
MAKRGPKPTGTRRIDQADWSLAMQPGYEGWVQPVVRMQFAGGEDGRNDFLGAKAFITNNPIFERDGRDNKVVFNEHDRRIEIKGSTNYAKFTYWLRKHNKSNQNDNILEAIASPAQEEMMKQAYAKQAGHIEPKDANRVAAEPRKQAPPVEPELNFTAPAIEQSPPAAAAKKDQAPQPRAQQPAESLSLDLGDSAGGGKPPEKTHSLRRSRQKPAAGKSPGETQLDFGDPAFDAKSFTERAKPGKGQSHRRG